MGSGLGLFVPFGVCSPYACLVCDTVLVLRGLDETFIQIRTVPILLEPLLLLCWLLYVVEGVVLLLYHDVAVVLCSSVEIAIILLFSGKWSVSGYRCPVTFWDKGSCAQNQPNGNRIPPGLHKVL